MAAVQMTQEQFNQLLGRLGTGSPADAPSKAVKPDRPSIDIDTTEGEWAIFEDQWLRFKRMTKLTVADEIRDNLRQCCSVQLNKRLFDVKGAATLNTGSEDNLLAWIKEIAVKGVHTEVHRTQFVHLTQKQGETITSYLGRLKSEAKLCDFYTSAPSTCGNDNCNCGNHGARVTYQDDMVATQLIAGLYNKDHQNKVFAECSVLITLDDKLKRLLIFEKSEASLSSLSGTDAISNFTGSNQKKGKWKGKGRYAKDNSEGVSGNSRRPEMTGNSRRPEVTRPSEAASDICPTCRSKHPQCPICEGYHKCTTKCNSCHNLGHIRNCCPNNATNLNVSTNNSETNETFDDGTVVFQFQVSGEDGEEKMENEESVKFEDIGQASSKESHYIPQSLSISADLLSHMEFINKRFQKMKPHEAPFLQIECKLIVEIHAKYGRLIPSIGKAEKPSQKVSGLADTGAQVCTAGSDFLRIFGIAQEFLIPTVMRVKGVAHSPVVVMGALFLEISASGMCTKQIVYIACGARSLILSEKALKDLGVIPADFPLAGMFDGNMAQQGSMQDASVQAIMMNSCGCPLRTELPPIPNAIPVENPEQNSAWLLKWVKRFYRTSAFNICLHQLTPPVTGPELLIFTPKDEEPVASHSPIPVPHHWKRKVKQLLEQNGSLGVMQPVPSGTLTTWCSRMLVTPKKSGEPRIVIDFQPLNAVSQRETHHTPTPWNLVSAIPKGVKKSILDAWNGYHSIPLAPESREKTTFITEWGRYRYLRAPQGFTGSGDAYTKRFDDITADITNKVRCIDDSCLWKPTVRESFWHVVKYIDQCGRNGIIFNPDKFVFAQDEVEFAGFRATSDTIKPSLKITKAISDFPVPRTLKGLQGWFGIVNQVAYAFSQSSIMFPFRELLQKNKRFYWDETLDLLFANSKEVILKNIEEGVKMFDTKKSTCLATDWSKTGVGFFLLQKHCQCTELDKAPHCGAGHWELVFAGSRFLKDPETRYSPIEGEALAVVFALEQTRMFILGCPDLILATDHKPLVPILNNKRLDLIKNPRLLHFKEKTLMYRFHAQHIPGPLNFAADATSRHPSHSNLEARSFFTSMSEVSDSDEDEKDAEELYTAMVNAVQANDDEVVSWDRVKEAAHTDDECLYLCDAIENGFPVEKSNSPECLRKYYKLKDELYTDGVPFLNGRMFIPMLLRRNVLSNLHSAHQGPAGMKASVRHRLWWLGMDRDIDQVRSQCKDCNEKAPSNAKEPLSPSPEPEYPWQFTVMDYFDLSANNYLVIADRYSGWPELFRQNGKVTTLIKTCRNLFAQFGVPEEISSDGGGPFKSLEWKQFLIQWGIFHRRSSANYPQSNGRAELSVKSCKRLLSSNTDGAGNLDTASVTKALLQYRNTPIAGIGMSPAYMLFGRQLRDTLPSSPASWEPSNISYAERYGKPSNVWKEIQDGRELAHARKQAKLIDNYNISTRQLTPLSVGDSVAIQNRSGNNPLRWDRTGVIVERLENKQYLIKADGSGRILLRTRTHLRKINPVTRDMSAYDIDSPIEPRDHTEKPPTSNKPLLIPGTLRDGTKIIEPIDNSPSIDNPVEGPLQESIPSQQAPPTRQSEEATIIPNHLPIPERPILRRSTRQRLPPKVLSPTMKGKFHSEVELGNKK